MAFGDRGSGKMKRGKSVGVSKIIVRAKSVVI